MRVQESNERAGWVSPGIVGLAIVLVLGIAGIGLLIGGAANERPAPVILGALLMAAAVFASLGFVALQRNQANVLVVLGSYRGTLRRPGWFWTHPLAIFERRRISLRARNFNSTTSKVNDANGNPIIIAAVVVWQVVDTARASFDVDDYEDFVVVQSETAVRHLAQSYPYDDYGDEDDDSALSLTGDAGEIAQTLGAELQNRLDVAGVHVIEARLTDLSYAPEIAEAMLRRQQASAVIAALVVVVRLATL